MVPERSCSKSVRVCVCAWVCVSHSPEMVWAYTEGLYVSCQCVSDCVWMRTRLKPLLPLWGGALKSKPTSGTKKKKPFYFKKKQTCSFVTCLKTQHRSSDNNPLIDNCSESTLRNQMFSDLYALRNRGVWDHTLKHNKTLKKAHHREPSKKYILSPATECNHDFVCSFFPESS